MTGTAPRVIIIPPSPERVWAKANVNKLRKLSATENKKSIKGS